MKKAIALALSLVLSLGMLAGCGGGGGKEPEYNGPSYDALTVGSDYTDLTAELRVITQRTDLVDTTFAKYVEEFNKLYPNIKINYEGITNYQDDMTARLSSKNWGDICMMPTNILLPDLNLYFHPLCSYDALKDTYNFASNRMFDNTVYGIPSTGNAQGVIYNKKVAEAAGYTSDADKLAADSSLKPMPQTKDPFAQRGDGTGPFEVYNILYQAVSRGLTEDSPTATDWEGCKPMMNRGEIGVMVLGSWAVIQMQEPDMNNAADIGYMPFPITQPDGKQTAAAGADYCFGVNKYASQDNKIASMLYIKWFTESSNFSFDQGGVPIIKGSPYPESLSEFEGIELIEDTPAPTELADLQPNVNRESEVGVNTDNTHVQRIVEAVVTGNETLDDIIADWNAKWNAAVDRYAPAK